MRTLEAINAEYSRLISELGVLSIQAYELPKLTEECRNRVYALREEYKTTELAIEEAKKVLDSTASVSTEVV